MTKIDIASYSYGNVTKTFRKAITWLNRRKKSFIIQPGYFDFPDYWGMPKSISSRLTGDQVDFLQEQTYNWQ